MLRANSTFLHILGCLQPSARLPAALQLKTLHNQILESPSVARAYTSLIPMAMNLRPTL